MDLDILKKLIKLVEKSRVNEIEIEEEGKRIRISKGTQAPAQPVPPNIPVPSSIPPPAPEAKKPAPKPEADDSGLHLLKSELVGTFYRASAEEAEPFVKEGDAVKKGQTLCIIEAMKIMNEIESDVSGTIVEITVENGTPVEYGEVLFKIEPV